MTVERRRKMEMENGRQVIGRHNDFTVYGNTLHIIRVEKGEAVLENVKTGRKSTYGIQALERVVRGCGYTIKKELLEAEQLKKFREATENAENPIQGQKG